MNNEIYVFDLVIYKIGEVTFFLIILRISNQSTLFPVQFELPVQVNDSVIT